jgi:hypothetical protein
MIHYLVPVPVYDDADADEISYHGTISVYLQNNANKNQRQADYSVYPRASFAKDVSLPTIWSKDTHRQGLGVD